MADYRPFWTGEWHLRLFRPDGQEVTCQEEQPDALLPFNDWRRRISFIDDLPGIGISRYEVRAFEGPAPQRRRHVPAEKRGHVPEVRGPIFRISRASGLVDSLKPPGGFECLAGPLFEPLVVEDTADSWGTETWSYRRIVGRFTPEGPPRVLESGPVRAISQSVLSFKKSRIVMDVYSYPEWPVLEFRLRVTWNEERRRLKLRLPTTFESAAAFGEVPGAAVALPEDGHEHVHGRWLIVNGRLGGREAALGVVDSGQPGLDFKDGEVRLSVLRSAAYCHERGFDLNRAERTGKRGSDAHPSVRTAWRFSDIGVHDIRLLVTVGTPDEVATRLPGLADYMSAPPVAYTHLPFGATEAAMPTRGEGASAAQVSIELLSLAPANIRLLACKHSWAGDALIVRLQEACGRKTRAKIVVQKPGLLDESGEQPEKDAGTDTLSFADLGGSLKRERDKRGDVGRGQLPKEEKRGHVPQVHVSISFMPFEIKTIRLERDGRFRQVPMIEEEMP
jgi:hypothetical protein